VLAAAALVGCGGGDKAEEAPDIPRTVSVSTPDFKDGAAIPAELTCDGAGRMPTIVWRQAPAEATELVLVVDDPDADFTHWTVYGLAAATGSGLAPEGRFPSGVQSGANSSGEDGWTPPCPPEGDDPHTYTFTMYALPDASGLQPGADPDAVEAAVESAVAYGRFSGTYQR
jgi:Raf kinase inhibitor-like YbhB/YbcL family protein